MAGVKAEQWLVGVLSILFVLLWAGAGYWGEATSSRFIRLPVAYPSPSMSSRRRG